MVRFANITNELKHFNGRCGLGAVMGSKKLRAIAVRGTNSITLFDRAKITAIAKEISGRIMENPSSRALREQGTVAAVRALYEAGCLPVRNWLTVYSEEAESLTSESYKTILKKTEGCYACPIRCKRVVEVNDPDIKVDPSFGGPEYETIAALGPICSIGSTRNRVGRF